MEELGASGWCPDLVISHSGWGCGLHVSWVFPKALRESATSSGGLPTMQMTMALILGIPGGVTALLVA